LASTRILASSLVSRRSIVSIVWRYISPIIHSIQSHF
jgi:hypothetical protein